MTKPFITALITAALAAAATACGADTASTPTTATTTASLPVGHPTGPGDHVQTANAPLGELLSFGKHCFGSGVEAVAAQIRAASAQAKTDADNTARQARGEMRTEPEGHTVVEDVEPNGTCYWVTTLSLLG